MEPIDNLLKKALTFTDPNVKYDPSKPPTTADEYLKFVMLESAQCAQVVTAEIDPKKLNTQNKYNVVYNANFVRASDDIVPPIRWQKQQVKQFESLRNRVESLAEKEFTRRDIRPGENWSNFCRDNQPLLTTVLSLSQPQLNDLIEKLAEDICAIDEGNSVEEYQSLWLYSSLAALAIPLLPDMCFTLRQISRKCSQLRAKLPAEKRANEQFIQPLNLIICLVSRYFNQIDLADN